MAVRLTAPLPLNGSPGTGLAALATSFVQERLQMPRIAVARQDAYLMMLAPLCEIVQPPGAGDPRVLGDAALIAR